jgi:hypothetical protein
MATAFRAIGATVAGLLLAFILVVAVEMFGAIVHPVPPDFGGTTEEMCAHIERFPHWVLAVVVPAWAGTALVGTWIAGRLGNRLCALVVGLLLLAALVSNIAMLPYATWFKAASVIAVASAVAAGVYLSGRRRTTLNVAE